MTDTPLPKHVFMSYSRKDEAVMRRVAAFLRKQGITVWVDNEKLVPGTPLWEAEVERAIVSAGAVVVLLSPNSYNSEWVMRETSFAENHKKRIFPVLIAGDERNAIPILLVTHQRIDIRQNEEIGLSSLSTELSRYLKELKNQEQKEREDNKRSSFVVERDKNISYSAQQNQKEEKIPETDLVVQAKKVSDLFARIAVTNTGRTTAYGCYGRIHKIMYRHLKYGIEEDITDEITARSSFISWSGGSTEGKKDIIKDDTKYLNVAELTESALIFRMQEDNPEYYVNSEFTIEIHIGGERNGVELTTLKDMYYLKYQRAYHASEAYSTTDSSELISSSKNFKKLSNHPDISFIEWRKEN